MLPTLVVSALYTLARVIVGATPILLEEVIILIVLLIILMNLQMKYLLISVAN
jgi:hypothetical protein